VSVGIPCSWGGGSQPTMSMGAQEPWNGVLPVG
jgi:hypothetical protein